MSLQCNDDEVTISGIETLHSLAASATIWSCRYPVSWPLPNVTVLPLQIRVIYYETTRGVTKRAEFDSMKVMKETRGTGNDSKPI